MLATTIVLTVITGVAVIVAWLALGRASRSADAAERAVGEAARSAHAAERSATAAESMARLAEDERSEAVTTSARAAEEALQRDRMARLTVTTRQRALGKRGPMFGYSLVVHNHGPAPAEDVAISDPTIVYPRDPTQQPAQLSKAAELRSRLLVGREYAVGLEGAGNSFSPAHDIAEVTIHWVDGNGQHTERVTVHRVDW